MTTQKRARELGMHRDITRRDFINGIAISALGAGAPRAFARTSHSADYYPPSLTGLRGSHAGSFEVAHGLRDSGFDSFPRLDVNTGEAYALMSWADSLSAALRPRTRMQEQRRTRIRQSMKHTEPCTICPGRAIRID